MSLLSFRLPAAHRSQSKFGPELLLSALALMTAALPLISVTPAFAADRVLQVPGACGGLANADAQFIGNRKHGRLELISFGPAGDAGFVLEGVEGLQISQLKNIFVDFLPPTTPYTFHLRIKIAGAETDKIQNFSIGSTGDNPNLPNLPTRPDGDGLSVATNQFLLLQDDSKLKADDVIRKVSFIFSAQKKGPKQVQYIDRVDYGATQVSVVLDPITCNLK